MDLEQIRKLPNPEKLKLMEVIWDELTREDASFQSPDWHRDELRKTEQRFAAGQEESLDWAEAKKKLRTDE